MALSIRNRIALGYPVNVMCDALKMSPKENISTVIDTINTKLPMLAKNFAGVLNTFTSMQKDVITYYYQNNLPIALVAQKMNSSTETIRRFLLSVAKKLRTPEMIEKFQTQPSDPGALADSKFDHFVYTTFGTLDVPYDTPIERYDLSKRSYNCLKNYKLDTLGKVLLYDYEGKFRGMRNLGDISIAEIRRNLYVIPPSDEPPLLCENMSYVGKKHLIWLAEQLESKVKPTREVYIEAAKQLRFLASVELQLSELFAAFYISVNKE